MNHTPTPWNIGASGLSIVQKDKGLIVAYVGSREDLSPVELEANAKRIVDCVNAMEGIEDPKKLRETYEACKHLELDKYQKLKGFLLDLMSDIHVGYELYPTTQKFKELENLIK